MTAFRTGLRAFALAAALAAVPLSAIAAQAQPAPTMVAPARKTIARVSMLSANPQALKRFYVDVLGFQPIWEGVIGEGPLALTIAKAWKLAPGARLNGALMKAPRGDMELQVTYVTGQKIKPLPRNRAAAPMSGDHYFVMHVPNLDAVVEKMKPFGIKYNRPPMRMSAIDQQGKSFSVYEAVIYDPEGTLIILVQDV